MRGILALALLLLNVTATDAPTLTDAQKLLLQNRLLNFRVAQLELDAVIKDLTVPGYLLDLQKLEYVKAPEKPEAAK